MEALTIIYLLVFLVFALVGSAILQIRMAGIKRLLGFYTSKPNAR